MYEEIVNWRVERFAGKELKPCPFCGFKPDIHDYDCIYPSSRERNEDGTYRDWHLNCYSTGGGCSASIYGGSPEECVEIWNKRV